MTMTPEQASMEVLQELHRARKKFPKLNSGHEGYAVILEELDELWECVKNNQPHLARKEAVQVAAMALAFMVEITDG